MNATTATGEPFRVQLFRLRACQEAREWVGRRSLRTAWRLCERGDWMLWLAGRASVDRRLVVLAACDCARMALIHVPVGEERPRLALDTAEQWCQGQAKLEEVRAAHASTYAAAFDAAAAVAASAAVDASTAASAASAVAFDAAAASAAAIAAAAAIASAAHDDSVAARIRTLARCADLVRARIPLAVIAAAMEEV